MQDISVMDVSNPERPDTAPLTPAVFEVLLALADGEKHGYAIMREVMEKTAGRIRMGPGTLYGSISRMLSAGLIEEADPRRPAKEDKRRRYYRLTRLGRSRAGAEAERLADVVRVARAKALLPRPRSG
jgi:DNA-binding PadR family transcriptional regulator